MRYSIITATLLRPELARLCDSINAQTFMTEAYPHEVLDCRPLVVFETDRFGR